MKLTKGVASEERGLGITRRLDGALQPIGSFLRAADAVATASFPASFRPAPTEADVRELLRFRRNRDRFFPAEIFADPAWDILLELYAAELGQRRMTVSCACSGAAVPATTALRWITTLEENQLIQRANDRFDGRRVFISLSDKGLAAMNDYFDTAPAGSMLV